MAGVKLTKELGVSESWKAGLINLFSLSFLRFFSVYVEFMQRSEGKDNSNRDLYDLLLC